MWVKTINKAMQSCLQAEISSNQQRAFFKRFYVFLEIQIKYLSRCYSSMCFILVFLIGMRSRRGIIFPWICFLFTLNSIKCYCLLRIRKSQFWKLEQNDCSYDFGIIRDLNWMSIECVHEWDVKFQKF